MPSIPETYNVSVGTPSHDALRAGTLHPTELSTNGAMQFVITFMNTIPSRNSMMPLLTVITSGLINTFAMLGPKKGTRTYGLILCFTKSSRSSTR